MDESLHRCLVEIRKRRAAVAELAWGADGPRLGLLDADKPTWLEVDHLLEIIDQREWQPIETAPKDGLPIWLANAYAVGLGYWDRERENQGGQCWRAYSPDIDRFDLSGGPPTHWQPFVLPDPPETNK